MPDSPAFVYDTQMESLNEHWLIIRSCNLKHLQYVNMIARKKNSKKSFHLPTSAMMSLLVLDKVLNFHQTFTISITLSCSEMYLQNFFGASS